MAASSNCNPAGGESFEHGGIGNFVGVVDLTLLKCNFRLAPYTVQ